MKKRRRSAQQRPPSSGHGALISSLVALSALLAYQCSDEGDEGGGLIEQLVTPSELSLPKSAATHSAQPTQGKLKQ